jgi:signal transduction histidine kinase
VPEINQMNILVSNVLNAGVSDEMPGMRARGVLLSNAISIIAASITAVFFVYALRNGWSRSDTFVFSMIALFVLVPILNSLHRINLSRILLTIIIPLLGIALVMLPRIQNPDDYEYLRSPGLYCAILAASVLPVLIFTKSEKRLAFFCHSVNFLVFLSIDAMASLFSKNHHLPTFAAWIAGNIGVILSYFLLVASVLSLKNIIDDFEKRNDQLINRLNSKNILLERSNRELNELNKNIETQNEEIQAQSEELMQSQEGLTLANVEIERQKIILEASLDEKSKDLLITNQQLVVQNNELQQFSYTVSHNLRGPVASILGLIHVQQYSKTEDDKKEVLGLLKKSALSLESIISDLNRIIDIRFDKFSKFETVLFEDELLLISQALFSFVAKNNVKIESNFQWTKIQSIKAYVNSILYNLLSNAIQYRDPSRTCVIKISTQLVGGRVVLAVEDNGLGIDLNRFHGDLFKLYKRFHPGVPGGKGLGLYLVKQQVEKLNASIEVESKPGMGSTFRVSLPIAG